MSQDRSPFDAIAAPRAQGTGVLQPNQTRWQAQLEANRQRPLPDEGRLGVDWGLWCSEARRDLIRAARDYCQQYRDIDLDFDRDLPIRGGPSEPSGQDGAGRRGPRIMLSGHQPELFHPGVWYKNFVLSRMAASTATIPIFLLIDNDLLTHPAVRTPTGTPAAPLLSAVAMDVASEVLPYEEHAIQDRSLFRSFGQRLAEAVRPLIRDPLIEDFWSLVEEASGRTGNLGRCLSQARHAYEARWGCQTLEVPLGMVCDRPYFARFAAHLFLELPRLHAVYNQQLLAYRRRYRVRSRSHPVPELEQLDGFLEAPFWIWTPESPQRRPLYLKRSGQSMLLTDRRRTEVRLQRAAENGQALVAEQIVALRRRQGLKVRPRALLTTLYARLVLGDWFVHGVGGAEYDRLTDRIVRHFYQIEPPDYGLATATFRLPFEQEPVREVADVNSQIMEIQQALRGLEFHPEVFLSAADQADPTVHDWIRQKREWIARSCPANQRRARHEAIQLANQALQPYLAARREALLLQRQQAVGARQRASVLGSREYAFALFPESILFPRLLELLPAEP